MGESNIKHVKGEELGSHDELQNNHSQLVGNSKSSCWTYYKFFAKPKASLEESLSIRQNPWTVKYIKLVISPSLYRFFSFINILRSNRYWWSAVLSYVRNSAGLCGGRNTTGKMKCTASRNCLSIIDLIKGRYVLCRDTSIRWKRIFQAILSKSFQEFSDTDQFVIKLFQLQMRISFPFLLTKNIHRFLLLIRTRSSSYGE